MCGRNDDPSTYDEDFRSESTYGGDKPPALRALEQERRYLIDEYGERAVSELEDFGKRLAAAEEAAPLDVDAYLYGSTDEFGDEHPAEAAPLDVVRDAAQNLVDWYDGRDIRDEAIEPEIAAIRAALAATSREDKNATE